MTKKLTNQEKKEKKAIRKQQKPPSTTVQTVKQPKHEEPPADNVNLCDDCAYEFGECDGKPKFAIAQDPTLTGAPADRVVKCEGFLNVQKMPTADQAESLAAAAKAAGAEVTETKVKRGGPDAAHDDDGEGPAEAEENLPLCEKCGRDPVMVKDGKVFNLCANCWGIMTEPETQVIRTDLPDRADPKRFLVEEDFGNCPSCSRPNKRTAFNRYQDAIRCTNPRCRAYRAIVKHISTGAK